MIKTPRNTDTLNRRIVNTGSLTVARVGTLRTDLTVSALLHSALDQ